MKKLFLGILVALLWCSSSYANISYTCYLTELPNRNNLMDFVFGRLSLNIDNNGSVHTEWITQYYSSKKPKDKDKEKIWNQLHGIYGNFLEKEITIEEAQKLMKDINPFLNGKTEFVPFTDERKFWDVRHSAGGIIQTTKELMIGEYDDGKSVEFWEFNLNKLEAVYNNAFTPEWIYEWNERWKKLSKEDKKKYNKLKVKPWSVKKFTDCKSNEASDSDKAGTSGTAFFISKKGYLLTNNHVVEGCKLSKINYFNKEYDAELIATDKTLDLALLKVEAKPKSYISFSKNKLKKRQLIIIAGYPLGEFLSDDLKINEGKISSLKGFDNNSNEITVDIAINPGNSGGPIVNEKGQLVAIAVAGMSKEVTEGISFGIKYSAAANFLKSNKINPNIDLMSFSMDDDKLNNLLEESTVYTFCN